MANTQVILLERVEKLGQMGDVVAVKPGFARNFLLPQRKALRANKANLAYFESQKKQLEAVNLKKRDEAQAVADKAKKLTVVIIRQAAEGGQLYGSVSTRDVSDAVTNAGVTVERSQVRLNTSFKTIGLFPVDIMLHPEVKLTVTVNIARSEEEAKVQAKTGKAMLAENAMEEAPAPAPTQKTKFLEEGALSAEEAIAKEIAEREAAEEAVRAEKAAKRATRKAERKKDDPAAEGEQTQEDEE